MTTGRRVWCPACTAPIDFETHEIDDGYVRVEMNEADLLVTCQRCGRIYKLINDGAKWFSVELPAQ